MKTELVNLSQISVNAANPRSIKNDKFEKLVNSLLVLPKMLELRPIVVDNAMVALGGNMRYRALTAIADMTEAELKKRIAGIRDFQKKSRAEQNKLIEYWLQWKDKPTAPIIKASELTEAEKQEFIIKDNAGFGEWDWDALAAEWDSGDLVEWGVDVWQEDSFGGGDADNEEDDFTDEDAEQAEPRVKLGEIWKLGEHRLMCGDSTDEAAVAKLMDGQKADLVFTDPPYGNNLGYGRGQLGERRILNDKDTIVLEKVFQPIDSVLNNNTHCLVWIQWRTFSKLEKAFSSYKLRTVIIWDKMQAGLTGNGFAEQYEMLCVFIKGKAKQNGYSGNVWQCSRKTEKREDSVHPHKKPIEILGKAITLCSKEKDLVLDTFGGSGSTLIACEQTERKCYMMELDPHYCDVIIARWEKFTGGEAVKIQ